MLCLTRTVTEAIRIGDDIRVVILRCGEGRVTIGFDAPDNVVIKREELWHEDQSKKQNHG